MTSFHNDPVFGGHFGQKKLYAKLRSNFYWKGMTRDIAEFIKKCEKCRLNKVKPSNTEPLVITPTPQKPFDVIIIDTCGPLTTSQYNNKYAVTIMCDLTKYLIVAAIPNKEAKTVARAIFENFVLIYGPEVQAARCEQQVLLAASIFPQQASKEDKAGKAASSKQQDTPCSIPACCILFRCSI